jgi:capsular polysaccharide biosynthesis protein
VPLHAGRLPGPNDEEEEPSRPKDATVDTEAQLVRSDEVISRLRTLPGFKDTPEGLRGRITLRVPANTRVITIGVAAGTPALAQDGAEVVGEAYLNLRTEILGGIQQRNREALTRQESLLAEQLKALPAESESLSRRTARTRRQAVEKQLGEVRKQLAAIDGQEVQSGEVMQSPTLPRRPEDRRRDVGLASGAGLGLLLALGAGLLRDRRPRRIRTEASLRLRTGIPMLGTSVPHEPDRDGTCRRLRNLVFDEDAHTVLLAGAPAAAALPVARELSRLCASSGTATALLWLQEDHDSPPPALDPFPRARNGPDAETAAQAASCTQHTVRVTDGDRGLRSAVAKARERAEIIVVTGPALGSVSTLSLATFCDLTIVVAERQNAVDADVAHGISLLEEAAAPARGLILTEPREAGRGAHVAATIPTPS